MPRLEKLLKNIPTYPGVYFFKDKKDKILYIGKAKNLKKRVSTYFNKSNIIPKNKIMLSKAVDVETLIVTNEVEALLTEASMIKKYKPKYNIILKDDKTFPYIIITNEDFPRVEIIREKNIFKNKNLYFGPYTDVNYLRKVLKTLHHIFPIRTCSYKIDDNFIINKKAKVCLDYHIEKCQGPCEGLVSKKDYNIVINNVIKFLKGKNTQITKELNKTMKKFSDKKLYEQAAKCRDQITALKLFEQKQTKVTQKFINEDVLHVSIIKNHSIGFVMRVRNGLIVSREQFDIANINNKINSNYFDHFLVQYYALTMDIPNQIIIKNEIFDKNNIEKWLSAKKGSKVKIKNPLRGESLRILDLCIKNSDHYLRSKMLKLIKRKEDVPKTLIELKNVLDLPIYPKRIEAFDNSNLNGSNPVSGLVCFINGKPKKTKYRHYNIKTVKGIDDFESMREIIYRRYSRQLKNKKQLPDLILIDGGKGQLSAAKSTLDKLGLGYINVIGLAKKLEEVYLPDNIYPQNISKTSSALYLLRNIRDEVHRFSIKFHRLKRNNDMFTSKFNNVKGLGKQRISSIWRNYNSISEFKKDSIKNINAKTNIPINLIKQIKIIINK